MCNTACAPACSSKATVDLLDELGLTERLRREGMVDQAIGSASASGAIASRSPSSSPARVTIYGQQEVVKDLIAARLASGARSSSRWRTCSWRPGGDSPRVRYRHRAPSTSYLRVHRRLRRLPRCVAPAIPPGVLTAYDHVFPFGWLGILAAVAASPRS